MSDLEIIIKHLKRLNEEDLIRVRKEIKRIIKQTHDR
jgi:hypothetical protein